MVPDGKAFSTPSSGILCPIQARFQSLERQTLGGGLGKSGWERSWQTIQFSALLHSSQDPSFVTSLTSAQQVIGKEEI